MLCAGKEFISTHPENAAVSQGNTRGRKPAEKRAGAAGFRVDVGTAHGRTRPHAVLFRGSCAQEDCSLQPWAVTAPRCLGEDPWGKGSLGGSPHLRLPAGSQYPGPPQTQTHLPWDKMGRTQGSPKPEAAVPSPPSFFFRPDGLPTPMQLCASTQTPQERTTRTGPGPGHSRKSP